MIDLTYMFGKGNESSTEYRKIYPLPYYTKQLGLLHPFKGESIVSKDADGNVIDTLTLDITTLTGKLNGTGESVTIFPQGMKDAIVSADSTIYDEIKQENGVWKAYKRIGNASSTISSVSERHEYEVLGTEEVYILDNQDFQNKYKVVNGGKEILMPINGATPTTGPALMEIEYIK